MVNFAVPRDFGGGFDFLAKAKSLRPRPRINITTYDYCPITGATNKHDPIVRDYTKSSWV